jgi:hypothetical protein
MTDPRAAALAEAIWRAAFARPGEEVSTRRLDWGNEWYGSPNDLAAAILAALPEGWCGHEATPPDALDVERLRRAIYTVSVRHDWANTVDTEDRTEEIAREYAALATELER